ncbi:ATP-binding protein [Mycobacterium sp. NPDC050551]|uniref:ATP-binding protein n=1 Tax=Mycobacterium sp. NPDC050551 TaxID=3155407 RepID=UPI00341FF7FC
MIDSVPADVANAENFVRVGLTADAHNAAHTREELARWLDQYFELDQTRVNDLLLATNEALANAAEFAYVNAERAGTMDILANFNARDRKLTVTITDHGTWRPPNPAPQNRLRGRGIPLMHALSDNASITPTSEGTRVHLEWTGVHGRDGVAGS